MCVPATFHTTPPFTSHHSTSHHHFHATSPRHLMLQHISPRTTIFLHTATTSQSTTCFTSLHSNSPHLTPFHIHNYFTPHPHSTPHHIPHRITPPHLDFTSRHHIWQHTDVTCGKMMQSVGIVVIKNVACAIVVWCHMWKMMHITLHMPHSLSPQFHTRHFTSHRNFPHLALRQHSTYQDTWHSTLHHIPHDTFCISIKTPCLKLQHSHHRN